MIEGELQQEEVAASPLMQAEQLVIHFSLGSRVLSTDKKQHVIHAVDGVSLSISQGETLALVGESGSGKTTLGLALLQAYKPTSGSIFFEGKDVWHLSHADTKSLKRSCQIVFQDPSSSLDPRMTIEDIVTEPLKAAGSTSSKDSTSKVLEVLKMVGLDSPKILLNYPHQLSGGQKQRVGIARALITTPKFVILDEPTSALDVSVQAQILNLLKQIQEHYRLTYLLITHNIDVARYMSDRVAVMYAGKVVEIGESHAITKNSRHPYTRGLIQSVPGLHSKTSLEGIPGEIASVTNPPSGCRFHPRCWMARDICQSEEPALRQIEPGHWSACHFAESVVDRGEGS